MGNEINVSINQLSPGRVGSVLHARGPTEKTPPSYRSRLGSDDAGISG